MGRAQKPRCRNRAYVIFNAINGIKYDITSFLSMLTGLQIRSARAALGWSAQALAERSGVSLRTLMRLEQVHGIPRGRTSTLAEIQKTLEAAGIEFIGTPDDGPGIRARPIL
jgi:DNA-binding transcriptional regulator YiaG